MASEWRVAKVRDLADSISETHPLGKESLVFLNTSDVLLGKIIQHTYSSVKDWPGQAKKSIRKDDILFSEIRPANGRYAYVDIDAADYVVSTKFMVIRARRNRILPKFLYHFLTDRKITGWLQHLAESRSGTFPQITFDQVSELELLLPPMSDQAAIAAFFDEIENKIELNQRMKETLEAMARAIFKSWFVDFDPVRAKADRRWPFGMDAEAAAIFPNSFQDSPQGTIPKGWRETTLGAEAARCAGRIQTGPFGSQLHASDYVSEGVPVIMPQDILDRRVSIERISRVEEADANRLSRHRVQVGDVIYSRRGDVERHARIDVNEAGWLCGTGCLLVRMGPRWPSPEFVSLALDQPESRAWITQHAIGATMPNLNTGILAAVPLVVPPDEILRAFAKFVSPMELLISAMNAESSILAALRHALLPKLISGEIRVDGTPTLENIK